MLEPRKRQPRGLEDGKFGNSVELLLLDFPGVVTVWEKRARERWCVVCRRGFGFNFMRCRLYC